MGAARSLGGARDRRRGTISVWKTSGWRRYSLSRSKASLQFAVPDNGLFLVFANGIGRDDDEIRTGNSMILDPYGRILSETREPADDMVVAELCGDLLPHCTGRKWIQARRPELYRPLTIPTGLERSTRALKFEE